MTIKLKDLYEQYDRSITLSDLMRQYESKKPFGIVSAFAQGNSEEENLGRHKQLKGSLGKLGVTFNEQIGVGQEEDADGNVQPVEELSYIVFDVELSDLVKLAKRYDQDFVIHYGGGDDEKETINLYTKTGVKDPSGRWKRIVKGEGEFMSILRGKSYNFVR